MPGKAYIATSREVGMKAQGNSSLDAKIGDVLLSNMPMSHYVIALPTSGSLRESTLLSLVDNWLHAKKFCLIPILYKSFNFSECEDPLI